MSMFTSSLMLWFQLGQPTEAHADQRAGEEGGKGICSPAYLYAGHGHYIPLHKAIDFISPSFFIIIIASLRKLLRHFILLITPK